VRRGRCGRACAPRPRRSRNRSVAVMASRASQNGHVFRARGGTTQCAFRHAAGDVAAQEAEQLARAHARRALLAAAGVAGEQPHQQRRRSGHPQREAEQDPRMSGGHHAGHRPVPQQLDGHSRPHSVRVPVLESLTSPEPRSYHFRPVRPPLAHGAATGFAPLPPRPWYRCAPPRPRRPSS
jgi:hypothetical protein